MVATPATKVLATAKVPHAVHAYDHDPRVQSYGDEAAAAMGVPASQVFKTLLVELATGKLAVAVLPVSAKLSLKAAASALGASKAVMADPVKAQRSTGYVLGGISPLGQKRPLPTVIDSSAFDFEVVYCSAGKRGLEISLAPTDLVRLTKAVIAAIAS